ncbi:hypothetical protein K461DRAFT_138683 [Myriangium duriaei CBS 260.36]|uniref:L-tryptophan decarboxylase PsiD-like domain-containing protein n=1 Tax=Myriangium duriaei CBS 260.36 TaxID=1168546 RepID=A0A9P4J2J4_9PEZI|nr:hypothetical protein K461DRAFT_138683 [Myriangium duriaei CBS 260.36]
MTYIEACRETNISVTIREARHAPGPPNGIGKSIGGWLPTSKKSIRSHVKDVCERAQRANLPYVAPIIALKELITKDPTLFMLFTEMLTEFPDSYHYSEDDSENLDIRELDQLLDTLNYQIQRPIAYFEGEQIGCPLNAILDRPLGTKAGFAAFIRPDVNAAFGQILKYWAKFLMSQESASTVTTAEGGWLSTKATTDSPGLHKFLETYAVPNPNDPIHYGFTSWDQFFTRRFLPGKRNVECPNDSLVICSATESTPFAVQRSVRMRDTFWAKDQRYSLEDMLGSTEVAQQFVGGTVYQAYLSADNYHNWHAPVSGSYVDKPTIIPGAYFSEPLPGGSIPKLNTHHSGDVGIATTTRSQGYISAVAQRGIALIKPDDPRLGVIGLVMIGMCEVSSIDFDVLSHFDKGDEIGRFHYGGSTCCLVFGPGVELEFVPDADILDPEHDNLNSNVIKVKSKLATVIPKNVESSLG